MGVSRGFGGISRGFGGISRGFGGISRGFGGISRGFGGISRGFEKHAILRNFSQIPEKVLKMFSDEFWFVRTKRKKLQRILAVFKFLPFWVAKT